MRRAERPRAGQPTAAQRPRDRLHHRDLQRLGGIERGQDTGQAGCHQRLARAGRPDHQQVVTAGRRDLQRALGRLLPLYLAQVGTTGRLVRFAGLRRGQQTMSLQMVEQRQQVGRGDHLDRAGPGRLRPLRRRADQALALLRRMQRGEQHARRGRDARVQPELADHDIVGQRLNIDDAHRAEQRERDRQVEMRAFLGEVGGRQVHRDPLGRHRQAHGRDRAAHPLAALAHRLVAQPYDIERG
jgi:hypothetical protein